MEQTSTQTSKRRHTKVALPPNFAVIFHNDDNTSFDFVVDILVKLFHKTKKDAQVLAKRIDKEGEGVAGIYSYDIAETKKEQATDAARAQGFPLMITTRKE